MIIHIIITFSKSHGAAEMDSNTGNKRNLFDLMQDITISLHIFHFPFLLSFFLDVV